MSSDAHPPAAHDPPLRQTLFVADAACFLCGAVAGSVEAPHPWAGRGPVRFRAAGAEAHVVVPDWRALRCARCGGGLYLDQGSVVVRRIEPRPWADEIPRRGRPPRWLVALRRSGIQGGAPA